MNPLAPPLFYLSVYIATEGAKPSDDDSLPEGLAQALTGAEITVSDIPPSGFQLVFSTEASSTDNDYDLMDEPLFKEFNRVIIKMEVDEEAYLLMDGYIVAKELDEAAGKVTLTGEDVSLKMDLFELSKSYPEMNDSTIVGAVLTRYADLEITTEVKAPDSEVTPAAYTPQQLSTDRDYLTKLASRNNSIFYIKFAEKATAYWGPQERDTDLTLPPLVAKGTIFDNVEELSPQYDNNAGVLYYGSKLADGDDGKESVMTPFGSGAYTGTALAKNPVPLPDFHPQSDDPETFFKENLTTLTAKGRYMRHQNLDPGRMATAAQSPTDLAAGRATVVEGEIDTARYGEILRVPAIIGVIGAGLKYDGNYYVQSVTHKMTLTKGEVQYMQNFTLQREGLGAKESTVETS